MKSEDLKRTVEKTKYENCDEPAKNYRAFARVLSLKIIKLWIKLFVTLVLSIYRHHLVLRAQL